MLHILPISYDTILNLIYNDLTLSLCSWVRANVLCLTGYLMSSDWRTAAASSPHIMSFNSTVSVIACMYGRCRIEKLLHRKETVEKLSYLLRSKNRSADHGRVNVRGKILAGISNLQEESSFKQRSRFTNHNDQPSQIQCHYRIQYKAECSFKRGTEWSQNIDNSSKKRLTIFARYAIFQNNTITSIEWKTNYQDTNWFPKIDLWALNKKYYCRRVRQGRRCSRKDSVASSHNTTRQQQPPAATTTTTTHNTQTQQTAATTTRRARAHDTTPQKQSKMRCK